jgi:hypothetical protein
VDFPTAILILAIMISIAYLVMEFTTVEESGTIEAKMLGPKMEPLLMIDGEIFTVYWTAYNRVVVGQKVTFKASVRSWLYFVGIKQAGSRFARDVFPITE